MVSSGCDDATARAKFALIPIWVELLELVVVPQTGVGVNIIIARMNKAMVGLLIAGIIVSPSIAAPSAGKIRVFLSATLY